MLANVTAMMNVTIEEVSISWWNVDIELTTKNSYNESRDLSIATQQ